MFTRYWFTTVNGKTIGYEFFYLLLQFPERTRVDRIFFSFLWRRILCKVHPYFEQTRIRRRFTKFLISRKEGQIERISEFFYLLFQFPGRTRVDSVFLFFLHGEEFSTKCIVLSAELNEGFKNFLHLAKRKSEHKNSFIVLWPVRKNFSIVFERIVQSTLEPYPCTICLNYIYYLFKTINQKGTPFPGPVNHDFQSKSTRRDNTTMQTHTHALNFWHR